MNIPLRAYAIEAAGECRHVGASDRAAVPALGLDVDDVKTEAVLLDDTVDPAVAGPTDRLARILQ